MVPQMQAMLGNVGCPAIASAASCASFHKLVQSGSRELTAQFAPAFLDQKVHLYIIYIVFDNAEDRFWVITADGVHANGGLALAPGTTTYGDYQEGQMVAGAVNGDVVPAQNGTTTWSSSQDGVSVSYYDTGDSAAISTETWQGSDGGKRTITISMSKTDPIDVPQVPETTTLVTPTQKRVINGMALKFSTPGSARP